MGTQAGERDDEKGGLGSGGPQDGPIGAGRQDRGGGGSGGEGAQRHPGGSSRDSESVR
jgi:hypothetical protein